jgi:hypothetical protein
MPDTGAPWFIPYADSTDLVRDWPALSEDISEAVADALDFVGSDGRVVQMKSTNRTTSFSASVAALGTTDVTGLAVTLTPQSQDNLVVVSVSTNITFDVPSGWQAAGIRVFRAGPTFIGDQTFSLIGTNTDQNIRQTSFAVDAPSTTSPVTYQVQLVNRSSTATQTIGVAGSDFFANITAWEIQA